MGEYIIKIFVTVGSSSFPFDRLIKKIDILGKNKKYQIVAQIGNGKYIPKNIKFYTFLKSEKIEKEMKNADIIISHAGTGSILTSRNLKCNLILVPRLKKYKELTNDHQIELCKKLEKNIVVCYDLKNLEKKIRWAKKININSKERELFKINLLKYLKQLKTT